MTFYLLLFIFYLINSLIRLILYYIRLNQLVYLINKSVIFPMSSKLRYKLWKLTYRILSWLTALYFSAVIKHTHIFYGSLYDIYGLRWQPCRHIWTHKLFFPSFLENYKIKYILASCSGKSISIKILYF